MDLTQVGFDGTGAVTLDVVSTQTMPAGEAARWAESLAARARLALSEGFATVKYDVTVRVPMTPDGARALAVDLEDRAEEYERTMAVPDLVDAAYDRIREEGKN